MKLFGIELGSDILFTYPTFTNILLVIIAITVVKIAFGKEIVFLFRKSWGSFTKRSVRKKHDDWVAICKERVGWIQKVNAKPLNLENRYLKKLTFEVSPIGNPSNWRAGFMLGNERSQPQMIVDSDNAVMIHTGSPPPIAKAQHVWIYDKEHVVNHPTFVAVTMLSKNKLTFNIEINDKNFLIVYANNQQVYAKYIQSSYRKKVYLLAWGDYADCKVKFTNVSFIV